MNVCHWLHSLLLTESESPLDYLGWSMKNVKKGGSLSSADTNQLLYPVMIVAVSCTDVHGYGLLLLGQQPLCPY